MEAEEPNANPGDAKAKSDRAKAEGIATLWKGRLTQAEKDLQPFRADVKRAIRAFGLDRKDAERAKRRFEIAWANREILQSAIYDRPPVCVVKSRYSQGDRLARAVSECMERTVNTLFERHDAQSALIGVRDELVDFSRGTAWVRYEPTIVDMPMPQPEYEEGGFEQGEGAPADLAEDAAEREPAEPLTYPVKMDEKIAVDFVTWSDFLHGKGRAWSAVPWAARRVWMTDQAGQERFPETWAEVGKAGGEDETANKGETGVWEIWCKVSKKVYFVAESCPIPLEVEEPFLDLSGFFPCPPPAFGTLRKEQNGAPKLCPIPDVVYYEGQLQEINQLTARMNALADALKVRGFYPGGAGRDGADAIEQAVKSNDDRAVMVPVAGWAAFGDKNLGIQWLPIDVIATVLAEVTKLRSQLVQDVYQITGISDILRGASEASETLGAQQIKAQWGSIRMKRKQAEMARMARDICRIVAEIVAEQFDPETISRIAQMEVTPEMVALMRDDQMRGYAIEVEADSTIQGDEAQMRQDRMEFSTAMIQGLTAAAGLITQSGPVAPEMATIIGETIKFTVRAFPAARSLEQTIEDAMDSIVQKLSQPPEPAPDPNAAKMAEIEQNGKIKAAEIEQQGQLKREEMAMNAEIKREGALLNAATKPPPQIPIQ